MESMEQKEYERPERLLVRYLSFAGRQAVGWVLVAIGGVMVIIGWLGMSDEVIVAKQMPYLMSGGIGGGFLLGLGALLLVSHELRLDNRRLERLESLVEQLHSALLVPEGEALQAGGPNGSGEVPAAAAGDGSLVVVLPGSKTFHDAGCTLVQGKEGARRERAANAIRKGLTPCRVCEPEVHAAV